MPQALRIVTTPSHETPSTDPNILATVWTRAGETAFVAYLIRGDQRTFPSDACVLVSLNGGGYHHAVRATGYMGSDLQTFSETIRGLGWTPASAVLNLMEGRT